MSELISVVVPVYNAQKQLDYALKSISEQTYPACEIIVVDDGSTEPIVLPHGCTATVVRQENKGAAAARNTGVGHATGEYIFFWDADVVAEPHMLAALHSALRAHPEAAYAYCNFYYGAQPMPAQPFDRVTLKKRNYISTMSLVRKRTLHPFDESLERFQDWDLWLTLSHEGHQGVWVDAYLFVATPGGRMSSWLPSFAYNIPWRWMPGIRSTVRAYMEARDIIYKKHGI